MQHRLNNGLIKYIKDYGDVMRDVEIFDRFDFDTYFTGTEYIKFWMQHFALNDIRFLKSRESCMNREYYKEEI